MLVILALKKRKNIVTPKMLVIPPIKLSRKLNRGKAEDQEKCRRRDRWRGRLGVVKKKKTVTSYNMGVHEK